MSVPLIAHVIYRLAVGGLENGLVNLINHLPAGAFRHAVIALDDITDFAERITRPDVALVALRKRAGHGVWCYPSLWRVLRTLRPALVHTRGLAALEMAPLARALMLPVIHGEHGWDARDPGGTRARYRLLRRVYRPFVTHYIALSQDIAQYLRHGIGVPDEKLSHICNGVDVARFSTASRGPREGFTVGYVGRMAAVKDPINLVRAFAHVRARLPAARLVMLGDGPLLPAVCEAVQAARLGEAVSLPGACEDVAQHMAQFDVFALPSQAEGISNTVLEAMACGLPVVATDVGGNRELVVEGVTGLRVPPANAQALADAITQLGRHPLQAQAMGAAARRRAAAEFSLPAMVSAYGALYHRVLQH